MTIDEIHAGLIAAHHERMHLLKEMLGQEAGLDSARYAGLEAEDIELRRVNYNRAVRLHEMANVEYNHWYNLLALASAEANLKSAELVIALVERLSK